MLFYKESTIKQLNKSRTLAFTLFLRFDVDLFHKDCDNKGLKIY